MAQKKNEHRKEKFLKKRHYEAKMMEFDWKTMNLLWSPTRWPISKQKAAQIYVNLNSMGKKKKHRKKDFRQIAISEAKTMEFGKKR